MIYYGGVIVANSDLYHHGILGQKWGRRNGPPYPLSAGAHSSAEKKAGYKKSIKGSGGSYSGIFKKKKKEEPKVEKKKYQNLTDEQNEKLNKFKDKNVISSTQSTDYKRLNEAAKLGIKALNEMGRDVGDPNDSINKEWFLWEDQTIGLGAIADLVVQGKSKEEIQQIIKDATDIYDDHEFMDKVREIDGAHLSNSIFELAEAYEPDAFIDACIKVNKNSYGNAKEDRKKAKIEKRVREKLAEIKKNDPEQYEQIKKNTIRTGKASDMKYFVDDMDNQELQYAINRIESKAKLNQLSNKEVKTNWDRAKEVSEKLKIVADLTTNAANIYTNLNKMTPSSNNQNNQQQQKKKN